MLGKLAGVLLVLGCGLDVLVAELEVEEWLAGRGLGQVAGVATDSQGRVHVFHRADRVYDAESFDEAGNFRQREKGPIEEPVHLILDPESGELLHEGGAGRFYLPHGLFIDSEDNVWLTDIALHQVFKVVDGSHEPALTLGKAFVKGNTSETFCQPTDIAVSEDGYIFVSDGYCNSRVVKFSPKGEYMGSIHGKDGAFAIPHSLALFESEGWNLICVADRENERVQCFAAGLDRPAGRKLPLGSFIREASGIGRVFAIRSLGTYMIGVTNGGYSGSATNDYDPDNRVLFVVNLKDGTNMISHDVGLANPHSLAVSPDQTIYIGEIGPNRVLKVNL